MNYAGQLKGRVPAEALDSWTREMERVSSRPFEKKVKTMGKNERLRRVAGSRLFRNLLLLAAALTSSRLGYTQIGSGAVCTEGGGGNYNPPYGCQFQCMTYNCTCGTSGTGSYTICISTNCYGQTSDYATGCITQP